MNIKQVMIFVDDIDAAKDFYLNTLKLELESDLSNQLGMIIIKNDPCLLTIHGGHKRSDYTEGRKVTVAFGVEDIESEALRLAELGVTLIGNIIETPVHKYQAFLDPSGNLLEVGQYK